MTAGAYDFWTLSRGMKALYWLTSCLVAPWLHIGCVVAPGLPEGLPSFFLARYIIAQ